MLNLTWQLTIVIVAVIGFVSLLFYIESKRELNKKDERRFMGPVFITIVVTLLIVIVLLVLEGFDVLPEGWAREHWYVFGLLMFVIWYYNYKNFVKLKPMKMEKLEAAAWALIYRRSKARPHRGVGYGSPMPYHNVTNTQSKDGQYDAYNKVVNFLARTNRFGGMFILVRLDIGNAYELGYIEDPDTQYVKRLFGKEVAQQFDIERALLKKSIEPDEYKVEQNNRYNETQTQTQASAY